MIAESDRKDPARAGALLSALCPSISERRLLLTRLLDSVDVADHVGRCTWAVTLSESGFRLNVGAVEALTFFDGEVRLFLHGWVPVGTQLPGAIVPCTLAKAPPNSFVYSCSLATLRENGERLDQLHQAYLRRAAVTLRGKPYRTPYAKFHSPGLIMLAQTELSRT